MHCLLDDNAVLNVKHLSGLLWFGECPCEEPDTEIYRVKYSQVTQANCTEKILYLKNFISTSSQCNGTPLKYSLAWEIPWMEEPGKASPWGHEKLGHD